jgi:hypothetical protein
MRVRQSPKWKADPRVKKLLKEYKQSRVSALKLAKKEFPEFSLEEQKAVAGAMRVIKRAKRLPPGTRF